MANGGERERDSGTGGGERERDSGTGGVHMFFGGLRRQTPVPRALRRETRVRQQWRLLDWKGKEEVLEVRYDAINRHIGLSADHIDRFFYDDSIIFSRKGAIGFHWEDFKAIITPQKVLFKTGPSVRPLVHKMQDWIIQEFSSSDTGPSHEAIEEFKILDFCLKAVSSKFDDEVETIERESHSILDQSIFKIITFGISDPRPDVIFKIKIQLDDLTAQVQKLRDQLKQLKEDENRKTKLCLTDRQNKPVEVGDLESLLNTYFKHNIENLKKLYTVRRYVDENESRIIEKRDRRIQTMFRLNLGLAIGGLGFGLFSYFHSK